MRKGEASSSRFKSDEATRERWWFLSRNQGLNPRQIAVRFGVSKHTVWAYLDKRKKQEETPAPEA